MVMLLDLPLWGHRSFQQDVCITYGCRAYGVALSGMVGTLGKTSAENVTTACWRRGHATPLAPRGLRPGANTENMEGNSSGSGGSNGSDLGDDACRHMGVDMHSAVVAC